MTFRALGNVSPAPVKWAVSVGAPAAFSVIAPVPKRFAVALLLPAIDSVPPLTVIGTAPEIAATAPVVVIVSVLPPLLIRGVVALPVTNAVPSVPVPMAEPPVKTSSWVPVSVASGLLNVMPLPAALTTRPPEPAVTAPATVNNPLPVFRMPLVVNAVAVVSVPAAPLYWRVLMLALAPRVPAALTL